MNGTAHDDVMTWKCFLHYWPFERGIYLSSEDSPHKGPVMGRFDIFQPKQTTKQTDKQLGGRRIEISWLSFEVSETISTDMIIFTLVFFKLSSDPFLWTGINMIEVGAWVNNYIQYTIHVLIWVNSSPSSAAYMCQWSGPALVQAMACHLFGTSHYLNQCWLIVNCTPGNIFQWNLNQNSIIFIHLKMLSARIAAILSRGIWVNLC